MNTYNTFFSTYTSQTLPPAQLLIGRHDQTVEAVELLLQNILCKNNSCNTCKDCMQIREQQHHALMWLHPEKYYTIDQFEDLFTTLYEMISRTYGLTIIHMNSICYYK